MPDLTEDRWKENSTARIEDGRHEGAEADAWSWVTDKNMGYGESCTAYTFFTAKVGLWCLQLRTCCVVQAT